jgi:monoamine oxidase
VAGGADVVVLEARARAGGRVEQVELEDGRLVQLGGEVTRPFQYAYRQLVEELGLSLEPAYAERGARTSALADGVVVGEGFPWMSDADRASYAEVEREFFKLVATVDPDDPWSHPDAAQLDGLSIGRWMQSQGATVNAMRARDLYALALSAESIHRTSLLSELRKQAMAGNSQFTEFETAGAERVAEGSATVALRMAEQLGRRVRYSTPVATIDVSSRRCRVVTSNGETIMAEAVVCAVPAGPLRQLRIEGVSRERLASLHRQRHAVAAKAVFVYEGSPLDDQQNGELYSEVGLIGGTWVQGAGVISSLVPPERLAALQATPAHLLEGELADELGDAFGEDARSPSAVFIRRWGFDAWTQGYITSWRPGDVMAVGPLHGTHEPPFYVCGSDQWASGYMEGAVRTGRAAAAEAVGVAA